jgi:hypothetical protein
MDAKNETQRVRRRRVGIVLAVYVVSLALPLFSHMDYYYPGARIFVDCLTDFGSPAGPPACGAALPNFLLWFGVFSLARGNRGMSALCGTISLLFSLLIGWAAHGDGRHLATAYYAWISSMALLTLFAVLLPGEARQSASSCQQEMSKP